MRALVYHGPGIRAWEEKPRPTITDASDAVVRITTSTICGTDLHILKGDLPTVTDGRILGHEGIGIVESVGAGVTSVRAGDKVLISCVTACGKCDFCRRSMYSHCRHGGWILGNTIDGTQAEYVRIPHADTSLYSIPADANEEALVMLSDILPTGLECGVLNGQVKPGDSVANVGVHGKSVDLHLEKLWDRNITITTRLVDTATTPMLLKVVRSGKLQPQKLVTHRFALQDAMKAYDTFANAAVEGALKVILTNSAPR